MRTGALRILLYAILHMFISLRIEALVAIGLIVDFRARCGECQIDVHTNLHSTEANFLG